MHSRNAGLRRLRSMTKRVGIVAAVLTGVFAGLAAAGNSGKHHRRTAATPRVPPSTPQSTPRTNRIPAPPSLPAVGDEGSAPAPSPTPTPAPPQQPPVQTQAPPAAVSGGS